MMISQKVKIDVADFSRDVSPKVFVDWLNSLEYYFAWYSMNDEQRIAFMKVKLKGPARIWWYGVENNELALGQPITRWINMKESSRAISFLPSDYINTLHQEYLTLQQGNLSVEEYTNQFQEYIVRYNLKTDDRLSLDIRKDCEPTSDEKSQCLSTPELMRYFVKPEKLSMKFSYGDTTLFKPGESSIRRGPEPTYNHT